MQPLTAHHGISRLVLALLAGLAIGMQAQAQTYPSSPLRLIVQYPAGGALDVLARNVMQRASTLLGQTIIVDNKPGASGLIAFDACAKAAPDGYTMCLGTGEGMSFNPNLFAKLPYNAERDFTPVIDLVRLSGVIIASADAPFSTLQGMIATARSKPGSINWASFGVASNPHIYLEWIKHKGKVDITHIPYKGSAQTIPALMTNEAQVSYVALGFVLPQIRAGKLKALAVTTAKRMPQLPDVPTLAELGLDPGFGNWVGIFVPAGTPRPVVTRLNTALASVVKDPEFSEKFLSLQAYEPVGDSVDSFAAFVKADRAVAKRVVQATGIKAE